MSAPDRAIRGARPLARARRVDSPARPIASALALPAWHVDQIDRSHERCAALGLSRIEAPDLSPLGRADVGVLRERNRRLHSQAAPVMEMLYEQIVDTESMVVLCDASGTVIHSIGDDDFLARASKVALAPGADWSEAAKGTNAVGTALVAETPTLVHADEHYLHANHFLTCSAAPILDPRGNLLGVLDVSGDQHRYHQHTMALVKMSVRMIENQWLADKHRHAMRLHFHGRAGHLGTLMEGIVAVAGDGRIVGANRSALEQLGLPAAALRRHNLQSLFGTTVGALVDRFRQPLAAPLALHTGSGRCVHLQARFDWPMWSGAAPSPAAAAAPRPAPAPARTAAVGLSHLLTGDTKIASLVARLQSVIDHDVAVLLLGETGSGRQTLARALHADCAHAGAPFVAVHCATLAWPQPTGLAAGRAGEAATAPTLDLLLQARQGTLLLQEIGELPLPQQAWLLQWLQQRGHATPAGPAIVCTSGHDLRPLVEAGRLRADLVHRLAGLTLQVPPLRERSDLQVLVPRLLERAGVDHSLALHEQVLHRFRQHPWPGNLHQLFNVLRSAALMAGAGPLITLDHLPAEFMAEPPATKARTDQRQTGTSLNELELDAMRNALRDAQGNLTLAARRLGVSRSTLYRKLRWRERAAD